jgi:hypothetical protein
MKPAENTAPDSSTPNAADPFVADHSADHSVDHSVDAADPQPFAFAAVAANARGDDPLQAASDDLPAADEPLAPLKWVSAKLPPVAIKGQFEADAMFAAITGKAPTLAAVPSETASPDLATAEALFADPLDPADGVATDSTTADDGDTFASVASMATIGHGSAPATPRAERRSAARPAATPPNNAAERRLPKASTPVPSAASVSSPDAIAHDFAMHAAPVDDAPPAGPTGAWWTLPVLFAGLAVLACALLVPAADGNRRTAHELAEIRRQVTHFREQSAVNRDFLARAGSDPVLAERLAMRQLRMTRPDARVVQMPKAGETYAMSPFAMMSVDAPPPVPAYRPVAGLLTRAFLNPQRQVFVAGFGIMLVAAGVILGGEERKPAAA